MTPDILDTAGAADYLGISCPTLERYRVNGGGPLFAKLTAARRPIVRYRRSDLDAWLESKIVERSDGGSAF